MKKLILMVIVISLMCSATMAFANGIETEEETVNCEIIEEQHNIDVNQGITGFGNIDVECCENISEEDEKDFLQTWDEGTGENDSDIMLTSFSGTGWQSCGTMTSERSYMSSVVVNNNIYTFGGSERGAVTNKTEMYNTISETWTTKKEMPFGRYKHMAVTSNDKVYICAGYDLSGNAVSTISVYDVNSNKWLEEIITPNNSTNYSAGMHNGELYIFSGKENGINSNKVYKYNFDSQTWKQLASMSTYAIDSYAVPTNRGFYVINNQYIYEYNIKDDEWTYIDKMPREVYDCAFVNRGDMDTNELYITGGRSEINSGVSIANTKYRYDTDSLSTVSNWRAEWYNDLKMIRGLACHNMVIADDVIYVFGGQVTYGEDQKLMFKRSIFDEKDDNPERVKNKWVNYIYGSINSVDDVDTYQFTPSVDGYYDIVHCNPIQSNNLKYSFNITIKEPDGKKLVDSMYTESFGATYLKAGKTYSIDIFDIEQTHRGNYMYRIGKVEDDASDNIDNALTIPIETEIQKSFIGKDDIDFLKFTIPTTGTYDIEITTQDPIDFELKTLADAVVFNANKKEIYDFNTYFDNVFNYKFKAGTYYIALKPFNFYYSRSTSGYAINIHKTAKLNNLYNNRARHGMDNINGKLYVFGGVGSNYEVLSSIDVYDPDTRLWTQEDNNTENIKKDAAFITSDNKLYTVGGYSNGIYYSDVRSYDTEKKVWRTEGNINTRRGRAGIVTDERYIYIIGGRNSDGYVNTVEVFDTATGKVSQTFDLPEPMMDVQSFISGGTLYIVGGTTYNGYSRNVYARVDDMWKPKATMPYESEYIRGKGYNNDFVCAAVNKKGNVDILKYVTDTKSWKIITSNYINDLIYYGFDIMDNHIYLTGGYSYDSREVSDKTYSYDILTDIANQNSDIPVRTVGFEYEQTNNSDIADAPEILNVNAKVLDDNKGIYELYLDEGDYNYDTRSLPFFFWSAREGMFAGASKDYRRVIFYADPNTGDRKVKVVVGIGDGRGYVDKKSFLLNGNKEKK